MDSAFLISQVCTTGSVRLKRLCAELIVNDQSIAFQIDTEASNHLIRKNGLVTLLTFKLDHQAVPEWCGMDLLCNSR